MVVYVFQRRSRQSFSRGEAAPVRTLGLKRNAGDCAGYDRQKRPANILPIRKPYAGTMSVDFCPYSSSVSHLPGKCDPPSPRGKVCACGAKQPFISLRKHLRIQIPIGIHPFPIPDGAAVLVQQLHDGIHIDPNLRIALFLTLVKN